MFRRVLFRSDSYGNNQKFDFIFSNLVNFPLDWSLGKFFDLVSSYMKPNSKAIFVRNSKLFNSPSGLEFRKKIVVSGKIESIVLNSTVVFIVLDENNVERRDSKIKFCSAPVLSIKEKRSVSTSLSIYESYIKNSDFETVINISTEDVVKNKFSLIPLDYISEQLQGEIPFPKKLKECAISKRGMQVNNLQTYERKNTKFTEQNFISAGLMKMSITQQEEITEISEDTEYVNIAELKNATEFVSEEGDSLITE